MDSPAGVLGLSGSTRWGNVVLELNDPYRSLLSILQSDSTSDTIPLYIWLFGLPFRLPFIVPLCRSFNVTLVGSTFLSACEMNDWKLHVNDEKTVVIRLFLCLQRLTAKTNIFFSIWKAFCDFIFVRNCNASRYCDYNNRTGSVATVFLAT